MFLEESTNHMLKLTAVCCTYAERDTYTADEHADARRDWFHTPTTYWYATPANNDFQPATPFEHVKDALINYQNAHLFP